ncbi:hypothetical protein ASD11_11045 [Aeromicrobium sp. Root495]|uniref:helix-turn-helix domain-containing protein n=1 Tax=Aeromicrobium sp. Root495 TaxID=1736550 RepID=UPI0006FE058C|nr:helix-turn-helix transcriptional regulator [Aeromicrobium sp. Root495]KQY60027.1 hypothetical protein ASD11_11045 [Aeromicrobium sp. Root495]
MDAGSKEILARLVRERSGVPVELPEPRSTLDHTLLALTRFWVGDFPGCLKAADDAERRAERPLDEVLAVAALGLAVAGEPAAHGRADWERSLEVLASHDDGGADWSFARYLVAEAALDGARLDVAMRAAEGSSWSCAWAGHPYEVMMLATETRAAGFTGRIDDALTALDRLRPAARRHGLSPLADAVAILLTGNADRADETQQLIDTLVAEQVPAVDYLGRGVYLLAAFGAISIDDVGQAASLLLLVDDDAALSHLTIIDRAIGLELLTNAAVAADDADAAHAWLEASLEIADHPIAFPACARLRSRVALHDGDATAAVEHAERAVEAARSEGRGIEVAEGAVVLARARIAAHQVAEASRGLREEVEHSDETGHRAMRRSAGQVLAGARRRLPPRSAGGWSELSVREREVAELVLAGLDTRDISQKLFLSPATVRTHLSRILCAFGVSSRIALLASEGPRGEQPPPPRDLTPRQSEVVGLVARGLDNAEVAAALGVSVKAVEKHVGDALRRWDVASRFELARVHLGADGGDRA